MAQSIVYSGGANGFNLYDVDPLFPAEYRESVKNLYEQQRIVGPSDDRTGARCYRFAPLEDRYVFSVIYKDCVCHAEKRPFFASVNWLFTAEEANDFLGNDVAYTLMHQIEESDDVLRRMEYTFPHDLPTFVDYHHEVPTSAEAVLMTAAYYATQAVYDNAPLRAQVFLGCTADSSLFSPIFWLFSKIPVQMRRHISFHIGAVTAEETIGVSLAVTYDDLFAAMSSRGNYSGAMAVKKIIMLRSELVGLASPAALAEGLLALSPEEKRKLYHLFLCSDNAKGFWDYVKAVCEKDTAKTKGASLALMIGAQGFAAAVENRVLSEKELSAIYREHELLAGAPAILALLETHLGPLSEHRKKGGKKAVFIGDIAARGERAHKDNASAKKGKPKKDEQNEKKQPKQARDDAHKKTPKTSSKKGQDRPRPAESKPERPPEKKRTHPKELLALVGAALALAWRQTVPFLLVAAVWLVAAAFGVCMFFLGVLARGLLPPQWLLTAYGIQIAVMLLIAMPIGYFAISFTRSVFAKQKKTRKKRKGEDD